ASGRVIAVDSFFTARREQLGQFALRHRVPAIYQSRDFAEAGGVMSYGGSLADGFRLVGVYTGRILKGDKPADLPVQQITKVELIVRVKTAKALGLEVPPTPLARGDEVSGRAPQTRLSRRTRPLPLAGLRTVPPPQPARGRV